jgi:hypothetical protein
MSSSNPAQATVWRAPDGTVISEADAARLAEEFEADDSVLDGVAVVSTRRAGRPSLTGTEGSSPQVTFRLSPAVRMRAEQIAADRGTTVSALAREALEQLVRKAG